MENTVSGTEMIAMLGKMIVMAPGCVWPGSQVLITGITLNDDGTLSYLGRYRVVPQCPNGEGMQISFDHAQIAEVL